ncbi:MAG: OmpA family protein [Saprospiraceae bacterium]|nr:OmpA family protein [Saprospiraceae bacterium]
MKKSAKYFLQNTLPVLMLLTLVHLAFGQEADTVSNQKETMELRVADTLEETSEYNAWETPVISDEMTNNPENHKKWSSGQSKYPSKPKDMVELGIHFGHYALAGDVNFTNPSGYGVGIHLRKALHYVFSIRIDAFYGQTWGLDPQPWYHKSQGGGLVEETFDAYGDPNLEGAWFPAHKTTYVYGAVQAVLNVGNVLFHKERNKWNWYLTMGAGIDHHKAMLDLFDDNGNPYNNLVAQTGFSVERFDTREGRIEIKKALRDIYDQNYETEGFQKKGIFRIGDETNVHIVWIAGMGVSRKLSKRINIGLEHQVMYSDNDYLDGIKYRTALDQTNNMDVGHYTSVRLAINLGDFSKRTEPLYWLNPMDNMFNDIAELKRRPVFDPTDTDEDGVIDILDEEPESPLGAPVNTKGRVLDSDGDGVADYQDQEPYSPGGFEINEEGVAQVPAYMTKEDVDGIVDRKVGSAIAKGQRDWFLPMIHFDLDKYCIKPEYYPHLHHVATVMQSSPDLKITVWGHTDYRNNNEYNKVLSYNRSKAAIDFLATKYGIERDRFNLMYGGEEQPLVTDEYTSDLRDRQQYLNRRVEFTVSKEGDKSMSRPEGPDAGYCGDYNPTGDTYSAPHHSEPGQSLNKGSGF